VDLRSVSAAVRSGQRNVELLLLAAAAGFAVVAWRALDAAAVPMPAGSNRILAQFLATAVAGHLGLRLAAPQAAALPYATSMLLTAVGLAFVVRLAPEVAQDQANWITLGVILMVLSAAVGRRYQALARYTYTAGALSIATLIVTGLFGTTINGARLWLNIGGQVVQTTELIKVLVVVFLAGYLANEAAVLSMPRLSFGGRTYSALPYLAPLVIVLGLAIGALALLRDLGSIALLVLLVASALFAATGRARYVWAGVALLVATAALGYVAFGHAERRIDTWLDPFSDPSGAGYQTIQSTYAIEAGGITGTGLGLGQPDTIPAAPTDYVFSAVAEELGLAGAACVIMLYTTLLFAGFRISLDAPETYGRLLAACISLLIAIQAAVIIGGNLRLIPTTGITLPFVSYGGSSLVVNFILVGVLLAISHRGRAS
jgi:cell division protein FtsW (lipid II flippase)